MLSEKTIFLSVLFVLFGSQTVQAGVRDIVPVNFGWQLHRGDMPSPSALDGKTMETVGLPHDFLSLYQRNIPEFITRDRNHPSVVMWRAGRKPSKVKLTVSSPAFKTVKKVMKTFF